MDTTASSSALPTPPVTVRVADTSDLPEVLRVQHAGFRRVARRLALEEADMAPVAEQLPQLEALHAAGVRTFIAVERTDGGERVVGTLRGTLRDDGAVEIGRVAVDDGYERRGIATSLMQALETAYPQASRFELYTGSEASDALALYASLGYRVFAREAFPDWTRVWLGKDVERATAPTRTPLH